MVPMASPFLNYFRRREEFWMPKEPGTTYMLFRRTAKIRETFLLPCFEFLRHDADCVFVGFKFTTGSRRIDLCEFSTKKKDLR
jgi:hypothetical protein